MTDHKHQIHEPLIDGTHQDSDYSITKEDLSDLFHPDNIKNHSPEDPQVSVSVYRLYKKLGGNEGLCKTLKTNTKNGIKGDIAEIFSRQKAFGLNSKRLAKTKSLVELIFECFEDLMLRILLLAALVALVIGVINDGWEHGWIEGASIFFAVGIIVTVTAGNNYMKEKQFQKLKARQQDNQQVAVFRGGEGFTQTVSTQELVVGDLIKIEPGSQIPADCIVVHSSDLSCDESAQTGEPDEVDKKPVNATNYEYNPNPFLLAKTFVKTGEGLAIVCAVGVNTRAGMAGEKLDIEDEQTPLQEKLETIANQIGKVGLSVAILTFIVMTVKFILLHYVFHKLPEMCGVAGNETLPACQTPDLMLLLKEVVHFFIIAITVVVVAMPEGLPLAVTISLAYSVMKMKQENNLVRKLDASETMGGADQICTDKTGTLTQNQMTVRGLWTLDRIYQNENLDSLQISQLSNKDLLAQGILFNCSARVEKNDLGQLEAKGNCTEQGLIKYLLKQQCPAQKLLEQKTETLEDGTDRIVASIPFNSKRKKATTAVILPGDNQTVRVFVKGAPDFVLDLCETFLGASGEAEELNQDKKDHIINYVVRDNFAKQAFRTLLIAYKDLPLNEFYALKAANNDFAEEKDREKLEELGLTVIGIYGLQDPLRPEIKDSVRKCHSAGITIRMVTGDNLDTAKAIAIDAGILTSQEAEDGSEHPYAFMVGQDFRKACGGLKKIENEQTGELEKEEIVNLERFTQIASQLKVLARSTPEDKYMLVTGLKQLGHVVAVTGDGTNDAPALKKADVGFAMGIAGTEVAKDSSDIIILDDNFASIVTAIKWGRNIYTNVRKFLQFQLTVNCVAMFIVFIGSVVLRDPPLTSVQMLWVNLIMDTCGALALATEPPSEDLLMQKPYPRNDTIVTPVMVRNIIGQALYQMTVLLVLLFGGQYLFDLDYDTDIEGFYGTKINASGETVLDINAPFYNKLKHYTLIFHTFVFMQIFNEINARKLGEHEINVFQGFFNNMLFQLIIVATIAIQVLMVQYGGASVRTIPLNLHEHLLCLAIGMFSLVQGVIVKKTLPVSWFTWLKIKDEPMLPEEAEHSTMAIVRKPTFHKSLQRSQTKLHDFQSSASAINRAATRTAIN